MGTKRKSPTAGNVQCAACGFSYAPSKGQRIPCPRCQLAWAIDIIRRAGSFKQILPRQLVDDCQTFLQSIEGPRL